MSQGTIRTILVLVLTAMLPKSVSAQNAEEIFQKGNSLWWDGKFEEALIYVDSSLNIDSSLYQRFGFRAELEFRLGMLNEAIDDISRCIRKCKCPTRKYHVSDYYLERAEYQIVAKNASDAMDDVNKSLGHNPKNWKAYNFRAGLFVNLKQNMSALADLDKSVAINDNEATTLMVRGRLRIDIGDLAGACSDFTKVSSWGIDEFDAWLNEHCKKK